MKVGAMDVKEISHEPLTDAEKLAGKERHEQIGALVQTAAYELIRNKLLEASHRAITDCLNCSRTGNASGAAFQAGKVEAFDFMLDLPRQLLSDS